MLSTCFGSFWLTEVRYRRESLCQMKNLSSQPRLAENNGLWGCITSFAFSWKPRLETGKYKSRNSKIHFSSLHLVQRDRLAVAPRLEMTFAGKFYIIRYWTSFDHFSHSWLIYAKRFCCLNIVSSYRVMQANFRLFLLGETSVGCAGRAVDDWRGGWWLVIKLDLSIIRRVEIIHVVNIVVLCHCILSLFISVWLGWCTNTFLNRRRRY